jgi:hypothetical protein
VRLLLPPTMMDLFAGLTFQHLLLRRVLRAGPRALLPLTFVALTMCGNSTDSSPGPDAGSSGTQGTPGSTGTIGGGSTGSAAAGSESGSTGGTGAAESGTGGAGAGTSTGSAESGSTSGAAGGDDGGSSGAASGAPGGSGSSSSGGTGDTGASVLQFHNHINRDGYFIDPKITKASAATMHNDPGFNGMVKGPVYATPLFVAAGKVAALNSGKGAVFIATETNDVYALDEMTGAQVWTVNLGPTGTPSIMPNGGRIVPQGVTGTPAIDLGSNLLVAVSAQGPGTISDHIVFGLDLATGMTKWKVSLKGLMDAKGTAFTPSNQLQRTATLIVNGYAYFGFGGNIGDKPPYSGWLMAVPLTGNMANAKAWKPADSKCGIWGPGGPSSDGNSIFVTTGNGTGPASWAGSEGVIRLGFDLSFTGNAMDYFAPSSYARLDGADLDISGCGPVVVDAASLKGVLALGKDGNAYLVDRTNMGGVGGKLAATAAVSTGSISSAPAWANIGGSIYAVSNVSWTKGATTCTKGGGDLFALKIAATNPSSITEVWCGAAGGRSAPIITSSDGTNDAIAWVGGGADGAGGGGAGDGKLHAYDLLTGTPIANSASIPGMAVLSSTLMVANGRIYAASNTGKIFAVIP